MRRKMLALSQERLGDALGLTFQQVQKYENGVNRIGASRLQHIATILQVPVGFFFDGAPGDSVASRTDSGSELSEFVAEFMATSDGLALASAFKRIQSAKLRSAIVAMVELISNGQGGIDNK
jgi:transcriptional regulator with XRE-family HTH domain